jgi:hypothetical protein
MSTPARSCARISAPPEARLADVAVELPERVYSVAKKPQIQLVPARWDIRHDEPVRRKYNRPGGPAVQRGVDHLPAVAGRV